MMIKVCGMREAENLDQLLGLEPEMVGLIFHPSSPRFCKGGSALADCLELGFGVRFDAGAVRKVGVFVNLSREEVLGETAVYGLDYVQLHGDESPGYCASVAGFVPVIKAFRVGADFDFGGCTPYQAACDFFLFDAKGLRYGGNGTKFDWNRLEDYQGETPFILSGGIGPDDVEAILALDHPKLAGIDLNSGFEIQPGLKNIDLLRTFFQAVRQSSKSNIIS